jgi:aspartokinase
VATVAAQVLEQLEQQTQVVVVVVAVGITPRLPLFRVATAAQA